MKTIFISIIITFLLANYAQAQDTLVFLSGRILTGDVKEVDSLDIQIEVKKRKKTKVLYIEKSNVFAIKYRDGKTDIYYEPLDAEEFTVREMELFIKGEQDALRHTKVPVLLISGIVIGWVSVIQLGPFIGLAPTFLYGMLAGGINKKVKETKVSNPDLLREDTYLAGYTTKAKSIKIQKAITGAIVGYLAGMATIAIYKNLNPPE